jgi:hypothetical protein
MACQHETTESGLTVCGLCGVGLYVRDDGSYSVLDKSIPPRGNKNGNERP